uniref:Uncharacterized protein n=1 Tax=Fagus sylvatica TaxID=28930 RepID=A0A2N9FG33_FAGSY
MVVQVPQVDEEDEPTDSSMVTLWPPNKDDADNDDLEWHAVDEGSEEEEDDDDDDEEEEEEDDG